MAKIAELTQWAEDIYRVQSSDPICGGPDGVANIQPRQLANRMNWLLALLGVEHGLDSGHTITDDLIAENAGISENKLLLDTSFADLNAALAQARENLGLLTDLVSEFAGPDNLRIEAIGRALLTLWNSAVQPFAIEFFTGELTMMPVLETRKLYSTVAGDDTVILESLDGITPGLLLYITDEDGANPELVQVKTILTPNRFLATQRLTITRKKGLVGGCSWRTDERPVVAPVNSVYITRPLSVYHNSVYGYLVIRRDNTPAQLTVEYTLCQDGIPSEWKPAQLTKIEPAGNDLFDEYYRIEAQSCACVIYRISNKDNADIRVTHMAAFPEHVGSNVTVIPAPTVISPKDRCYTNRIHMESSTYYNAYRDPLDHVEFQLVQDDTGITYTHSLDVAQLSGDFEALDAPEGMYSVRCRQWSDTGDVSDWSEPVRVYITELQPFYGFKNAPNSTYTDKMISLSQDLVRFGFADTENTAGFDEAMFINDKTN